MTLRETFIALVDNEPLRKCDVIVLLEGDGFSRIGRAVELYKHGWAPLIVVSGGVDNPAKGSYPAPMMRKELIRLGVPSDSIMIEESSTHTRAQAQAVMELARRNKWEGILLVASHYHQYRAYLTFLKAMLESGLHLVIVNSSARDLPWFEPAPWGKRLDLMVEEFQKITKYRRMGHVATLRDALAHQEWKEARKLT